MGCEHPDRVMGCRFVRHPGAGGRPEEGGTAEVEGKLLKWKPRLAVQAHNTPDARRPVSPPTPQGSGVRVLDEPGVRKLGKGKRWYKTGSKLE